MILELDMIQTVALAVVVLLIGQAIRNRVEILRTFCIPAPVVGGMIFAILALFLRQSGIMEFQFDTTLQSVLMTAFFTTVGFTASLRLLKQGGLKVIIFLFAAILLVVLQNAMAVGFAKVFDLNPLLGLATGSVPMTGGHGTSGAFGPLFEEHGAVGAATVALASATFGLIGGSMLGGPLAKRLIEKHNLVEKKAAAVADTDMPEVEEQKLLDADRFLSGAFQIALAMGLGTIISMYIEKTGMTFPSYIGAMLAAAIIRNISDMTNTYEVPSTEIAIMGDIGLSMFLSMALMGLKLWELADLAIPMIVMLIGQTVLMAVFAYFVTFNMMGRDYDAAVLAGGHCGFGMGATPNAIANMQAITGNYGPSPLA
ncbi:MAG: sodium/glutamate symporter, partial [Clostridiales bacterium]|nr:sodium/glutamate symporter [Clostridiales bacterium]